MLLFWDQRLVFLATPKAGSTAIETALESLASVSIQRPAPLKHLSARDFRAHLASLLQARGAPFTTVALMREPLSWLQSWYRFRLRDDQDDPDHPMRGRSFEDFVNDYMAPTPPAHADLGCQSDYLTGPDGTLLVDRLFRYEDIDALVHFLEDRLDCMVTLPRINVPPSVNVTLSPQAATTLQSRLAPDFTLYRTIKGS